MVCLLKLIIVTVLIIFLFNKANNIAGGKINICTSGCLRNQGKCWDNNKLKPTKGIMDKRLRADIGVGVGVGKLRIER